MDEAKTFRQEQNIGHLTPTHHPTRGPPAPGAYRSWYLKWRLRVCGLCDIPELIFNIHQSCQPGSTSSCPLASPGRLNVLFTPAPACPFPSHGRPSKGGRLTCNTAGTYLWRTNMHAAGICPYGCTVCEHMKDASSEPPSITCRRQLTGVFSSFLKLGVVRGTSCLLMLCRVQARTDQLFGWAGCEKRQQPRRIPRCIRVFARTHGGSLVNRHPQTNFWFSFSKVF